MDGPYDISIGLLVLKSDFLKEQRRISYLSVISMYRFIASWFKILGKAGLMGFCKPIQLVKNHLRGTDRCFWGLD